MSTKPHDQVAKQIAALRQKAIKSNSPVITGRQVPTHTLTPLQMIIREELIDDWEEIEQVGLTDDERLKHFPLDKFPYGYQPEPKTRRNK